MYLFACQRRIILPDIAHKRKWHTLAEEIYIHRKKMS